MKTITQQKPTKKLKKKSAAAKWLPTILAVLLVLGLAAAAVWFFFIRKDTLTIDAIEITDRTVDSITVSLTTQEAPDTFQVICTDAYGNVIRQPYVPGQPNTFTALASGAQYTFSVEGFNEEIVDGVVQHNASTMAMTNIISFSVSRETVSEIEVTFIPDGAEPTEWSISYGPVGGTPLTKVFSGHSVILTGLNPDTEYEITLLDPSDFHLTGTTTTVGHTLASVTITGVSAIPAKSAVTISWEFEGEAPANWNVTTTGTEGYTDNQVVSENTVYLENLRGGETYNIVITCDNMISGASATYAPNALEIVEITAEPNEEGNIDVKWSCEADAEDTQWLVIYTLVGSDNITAVEQTTEQAVTLSGLIPGSTYSIEIQEANGEEVGGETKVVAQLPAVESFSDYGFTKAYVSMWLRPEQEDWTVNHLMYVRTTFKVSEPIAFACESVSAPQDSEDPVTSLLVVRNENGSIIDYYTGEEIWNNMWTRSKYVGELLRTPSEPGEYTLEIYFNGKRVKTDKDVSFTVTEG